MPAAQMCLVAAAVLAAAPGLVAWASSAALPRHASHLAGKLAVRGALLAFLVLSTSRITAILLNYGAPMHVYRHLPEVGLDLLMGPCLYTARPWLHDVVPYSKCLLLLLKLVPLACHLSWWH